MAQIRLSVQEADGYLPAVCMCCGRPATTTVTRTMRWQPGWVHLMVALAILFCIGFIIIYIIVTLILSKRVVVQAPLCDDHKGHWFKRTIWMVGSFFLFGLAGVGSLVFAANLDGNLSDQVMPFTGGFCLFGLLAWLIIVIVCQNTAIRPKEITDTEVLLTGVSDEFVEAVADADREREERRAARRRERERPGRWRDEADDIDDDVSRRRRPTDDRIEE